MKTVELKIEGMSCGHCVKAVEVEFEDLGLKNFKVEVGKAEVEYDESELTLEQIEKSVEEAGFKVIK